jgi:Outer membrane protein and related peptidoglycan-associated (lipo)proteins
MKKKVLILLFAIAPIGLFAQNTAQGQEKALKQYGFWDNWFIQGQIGAQRTYSESHKYASFGDKLSPTAALGVGKFFSPEVGARLQLGGWTSSNYINGSTYDVKYLNGNVDALFNLTNIFLPYKEHRVFNLIGILGAGYVHGFKDSDENLHATNSVAPRIGLQADFRLSKAWSINLEANGNLLRDDFNGQEKFGCSYDGTLNVLAGVTYRFGRRGFATVNAADPALIQSLNDQINSQRAQIEEYKACCEKKSAEPKTIIKEVPTTNAASLNSVVTFRIGKATIDPNQEVYVYNAAQYLKQNPDAKVSIGSFADKNTGTAAFNQKLSEKRSEAVAKMLKEKYGIAENRFTVENNGDKQQPYPDNNDWNRISIITSK